MAFSLGGQQIGTGTIIPTGPVPLVNPMDPNDITLITATPSGIDPSLEFNKNRKKTPSKETLRMSPSDKRERRRSDRREHDKRDSDRSKDDSDSNMSNPTEIVTLQNGSGIAPNMWGGVVGMGYPMVGMNMIMDPNMMPMNNYGMVSPIIPPDPNLVTPDPGIMINPVKEIIHCKSCTLFPPNPNAPPPTTRERPLGCRTVFVGGLPENMTEEIIREVFERCGEITTLRLSKKNFCHIRFLYEHCVDHAIFLSGYRIRIGSNTDPPNTGRLHVDYAQARDDQYEWECRQRQLQREQRHRERMEEERLRPPSPPPIVHYTDHEAQNVAEKLKQDETFTKAVQILVTWLERGDCSKRNSNTFYSMVQSTNSHVRRLLTEKTQYEEELQKAKEIMKGRMQGILLQFSQIERVFLAACHKKVWDHFTKAQRKNIELWKKQSMELKNVQLEEETPIETADDEMEVSDGEENPRKKTKIEISNEDKVLKEENDNLRFQMEAYKNEVEVLKRDYMKEIDEKEKQLKILQQTLKNLQQQLVDYKLRQAEDENKMKELQVKLQNSIENYANNCSKNGKEKELEDSDSDKLEISSITESTTTDSLNTQTLNEKDAKLVGIISTFLNVHPFGAGLDYIWSYVSKLDSNIKPSDIEVLMTRFPNVFKQEIVGIGANMERRWLFNVFIATEV
ncbi:ecto-NOX disulfide-thiol exchanger 2 [Agrilus planipennis]|uniref:Ecto-NOX disulfide-thiol exchanger 2 n=1 Tax=Agrilus planipennis TaxID=224129 RepID=A0A7F5R9E4_AGRPL|nr:ecto-NOX disulfide-thiol exchanger 2 [Agrilus planipennis]